VELERDGARLRVAAGDLVLGFDEERAALRSLVEGGRERLREGPHLQVWRAPIDNDGIKAWDVPESRPLGRWRAQGLETMVLEPAAARVARRRDGSVEVVLEERSSVGITHRQAFRVRPDGSVRVVHRFRVPEALADLPRLGVRWVLAPGLDRLAWWGRGPHESYPDRKAGARLAVHENRVADEYVPYIVPQEHGLHCDVRWLRLLDGEGAGLAIHGAPALLFSASHYTAEDLTAAGHTHELTPRREVVLSLDAAHRGLGTGSCGPDTLPRYRIRAGARRLAYTLRAASGPRRGRRRAG
jgi:beta-galactosidase